MFSSFRTSSSFNFIVLFIGVLCIAWSAIFVKLSEVPGLTTAFYRMAIGFAGVLPIWYFNRKPNVDILGVKIAVICGLLFATDIALWNSAIVMTKAGISTLLANLSPVWVGLGALVFLKQKPNLLFWIGTVVSLFGVAIILGLEQMFSFQLNSGNVLSIVASMFYGAYMLTATKARNHIDTLTFSVISMGTSAAVLLLVCLFFRVPLCGFEMHSWWALLGVGLVPQLAGWLAINYSLKFIKPTTASVTLLSQSVFTVLFSVPVLGEYLSWYELLGAIVVLFGVYLVNSRKHI